MMHKIKLLGDVAAAVVLISVAIVGFLKGEVYHGLYMCLFTLLVIRIALLEWRE